MSFGAKNAAGYCCAGRNYWGCSWSIDCDVYLYTQRGAKWPPGYGDYSDLFEGDAAVTLVLERAEVYISF